jgi:hypothetical protein
MKSLLNSSLLYLIKQILWQAPVDVISAVGFKGLFLLFQISSIWIMISWVSGNMLPAVKGIIQLNDSSYVYLAVGWLLLIAASASSLLSRWLALRGVGKLEQYVGDRAGGSVILVSDYRNLTKVMLGVIDAIVPFVFITCVLVAWIIVQPGLIFPIVMLVILVGFLFRKGIVFSAEKFENKGEKVKPEEYLGSTQHKSFKQILMVSQYISLVVYALIATGIVGVLVIIDSLGSLHTIGLLPVATAIALLQFKSFISLLVRLGAYVDSVLKVSEVLKNA